MKTFSRLSLWALVLLWACSLTTSAQPVQNGYAAGTCYSDLGSWPSNPDGYVVVLMDVRQADIQPLDQNWSPTMWHGPAAMEWKRSNLGEVFGICFDPAGNIYVAASIVYGNAAPGGPGGSGAIYKLDATTGAISTFAMLPNGGNVGLGNIAWDKENDQMFATNFEDGKIYRISSAGVILSKYDPFNDDPVPSKNGLAAYSELIWGIGVYQNRVYFGRWNENTNNASAILDNQVWSVSLTASGEFNALTNGVGDYYNNESLEITTPAIQSNWSNPVSDIAFAADGRMLLAERTVEINGGLFPNGWPAHQSRVLEYVKPGASWIPSGTNFTIGAYTYFSGLQTNSAGGTDYAYGSWDTQNQEIIDCDEAMWASGDALHFGSPYTDYIYGWQWLPSSGGNVTNSVLIDADGVTTSGDKTQIGDIEVYKICTIDDCPDINITVTPNPTPTGDCCYDLTFATFGSNEVAYIIGNIITPSTTFSGVLGPSGWNVTNSGTTATWDSSGCIPQGSVSGIEFCIQTQVAAPQQIEIIYVTKDGERCRDTIDINCDTPPNPCVVINDENIECREQGPNGWLYDYSFTVTNYSPFSPPYPAENVLVYSVTPGVSISPANTPLIPTLGYGGTSGTLGYTISGPGAQPGDQVCIVVQLHGAKLKYDYQWCCPPDTICFTLPDCRDCCDSVDISFTGGGGKQVGNTAASISSTFSVTPGPVMKMQASVMSVSRSRVWCPDATGLYTPVANPTTIAGVIYGASLTPTMPVAAGLAPPTSEVIWGTVYNGVDMSSGQVGLNLTFPGTSLGWRCRDTLTICMRYTFTDTAWVTCDTVVYYKVNRCGRIDIVADNPNDDLDTYKPLTEGVGITIGEPLYSNVVEGPQIALNMNNYTSGQLQLTHWWQDQVVGVSKIRLRKMYVTPEAGIDITAISAAEGAIGRVIERTAEIDVALNERETDNFNITFSNPTNASFFSARVSFDYVDADYPQDIERSREYVIYGDLSGGGGASSLSVSEDSHRATTLYKLLIQANNSNSAGWVSPSCFRFTPPDGVRIIASGPMQSQISSDFHVLRPIDRQNAMLMPLPTSTDQRGSVVPSDGPLQLWLVLEGDANLVDLGWEALNNEGNAIARGTLELSATSTVRDDDGSAVAGGAIYLLEAYPNPSADQVTTRFNLYQAEDVTIEVYDLTGKLIRTVMENRSLTGGTHEYKIDLAGQPDGVYYIRMSTEHGSQTRRVVKQR